MLKRRFDALVIGAGGAGLQAALRLARIPGVTVAVASKVFPTRSHTASAQGGINAALANVTADNWHWHMFDTVKGSDYLGDQDAIEFMCQLAPRVVIQLEHHGVPFSRLASGRIYQRPFGGQSQNFGGDQATRTCAAADRTGHALLHALYQQNLAARTNFFPEYFAIDLVRNPDGTVIGALLLEIATGELLLIEARVTLIATGGAGQLYRTTSTALTSTGDGLAMALRAGIPLEDMEFFQFHPTGIAGKGMLISEGVRGEGGYLINRDGERFMGRYAPHARDLASRDVVARAIATEVHNGRGCGPQRDHVLLKLDHLGAGLIAHRLPAIRDLTQTFLGLDPALSPIPVFPTCHYLMGGIPTNRFGQVVAPTCHGEEPVPGLYAAGECACVSVHGANRLGGNSLLDILVFGSAAADAMAEELAAHKTPQIIAPQALELALARINRWQKTGSGPSVAEIRNELQLLMEQHCGVFRSAVVLTQGIEHLDDLIKRLPGIVLRDQSQMYNMARIAALELDNLVEIARATLFAAFARQESRGAHTRIDYPARDDINWLKHTLYFRAGAQVEFKPVRLKPLTVEAFPPRVRTY